MREKLTDRKGEDKMQIKIGTKINSVLSEDIGIDIGSYKTAIYIKEKGIVLNEPSYIAVDEKTNEVVAFGKEAYEMIGKNPPSIRIERPIENGIISDMELAVKLLKIFISKVYNKTLLKPRVIANIPTGSTEIERHAMSEVLKSAGARAVYLLESPIPAALGAGCDISIARGLFVADIGAGKSDVSTISLGRNVVSDSINIAGDAFTNDIIKHIKSAHNLNIGFLTAEAIKKTVGCAYPMEKLTSMSISGCDVTSGLPRFMSISSEEIRDCLMPSLTKIANVIKNTLKNTPTELQTDILEDGILLTGGGAKLSGLDKYLRQELEMKVFVLEDIENYTINGIGKQLMALDSNVAEEKFYYAAE